MRLFAYADFDEPSLAIPRRLFPVIANHEMAEEPRGTSEVSDYPRVKSLVGVEIHTQLRASEICPTPFDPVYGVEQP